MKKILYISLLIAFSVITGCSKGGDEPEIPTPTVELTEDALIGIWETYYYEKQISTGNSYFNGLRYIDYDGFRTKFEKKEGKYIVSDYNLAGNLVLEAEYYVVKDTIKFERQVKTDDGRDSTAVTWQRVREFAPQKGIIIMDNSYSGVTKQDGTKYKITDIKRIRNVKTAPTSIEGVNPAKVMVDYDALCEGTWKVYLFKEYRDGDLDQAASKEGKEALENVSFKFFVDEKGNKKCLQRDWHPGKQEWIEDTYPVLVIDDVVHRLYQYEKTDEDGNIILDENGEKILEDGSLYMWVTAWKDRDGAESFIDFKETRYHENVKVVIKQQIYMKQILD